MAEQIPDTAATELERIHSQLRATRSLLRISWILIGSGLTLGLSLSLLVAAALTDLVVPLPVPARAAAFLLVVVPSLLALVTGVLRPLVRRLSDNIIARRIERSLPNMDSRLVTSLDLARHREHQHSEAFFGKLVAETAERLEPFRPQSMVDRNHLRRSAVLAAAGVLAFACTYVAFSERLPTAIARVLLPLADIAPATGVRFSAEPGDADVLLGDDLTIAGVVEQGEPGQLTMEMRGPDGRRVRHEMVAAAPGRFEFTVLQPAKKFEYRLLGGGTWTRQYRVAVLERPAIVDLHTVVRFPEYLKLPEPVIGAAQNGDAIGPAGSDVEVVVEAAGDVAAGELQLVTPVTKYLPRAERKERVWFETQLPAGASGDGAWQWDHALKFRPAHTDPAAAGPHGHGFHSARAGFSIQPSDHLYTYVFIVPEQPPEEIMLQFHDGKNWEHRAFWGADKIMSGAPNSPSRHRAGDLPPAGEWVLLDVPAQAVGLDGAKIHGVQFTLFGGQAKFHRFGAIEPAEVPVRTFVVDQRIAMTAKPLEPAEVGVSEPSTHAPLRSVWSGHIPLTRDGWYRIELKNQIGYTNKDTGEHKLTAIPDNPPHVAIDRPGTEVVISTPQKVPLVIRADDDFGLADVSLAIQPGDSTGFVGSPIRTYDEPMRRDSIVGAIDAEQYLRKPGDQLRYRILARDRKGQTAETKEYVVRLAADGNAADKLLAALDQQQDAIDQKLQKLIEQQAKITEAVEAASAVERPMSEPGESARGDSKDVRPSTAAVPKFDPPRSQPRSADTPMTRQPEQIAAQVRQQLTEAAQSQTANAELGQQFANELKQSAARMAESRLLPELIADQMRGAEQLFEQTALEPMRELAQAMRQAAENKSSGIDAADLAEQSQQIEKKLESLKSRLDALAQARQNIMQDPAQALADLRRELTAQNAELSAQELAKLNELIDRLMGQMKLLEGRTSELARQTKDAPPVMLPELEREQSMVEHDAERLMDQAEPLMDPESLADSNMPSDDPHANMQRPSEGVTQAARLRSAADEASERLPGGVRQRMDPRFARPSQKPKGKSSPGGAESARSTGQAAGPAGNEPLDRRGQLAARQQQTVDELGDAQRRLEPRRQQLGELMEQLRQALGLDDEGLRELARLMQSAEMRQALQLAAAMDASTRSENTTKDSTQPAPTPASNTPTLAGMIDGLVTEFQGNEIDLAAEAALLRMQPRLREELLRGMSEQGPEAYRKFIQDYFNRLTKVRPRNK